MEATTLTKPASLFGQAKAVEKKKDTAKQQVILPEAKYEGISYKLEKLTKLREHIAEVEGELKMVEGEVKAVAKDVFLDLYRTQGRNPDSFVIRGEKGGALMVLPMDKYLSIDEQRYAELTAHFGDVASKDVKYVFNAEVLSRNEAVISDLIMNCGGISEADKANLLQAEVRYTVRKGMIDRLHTFGERMRDVFTCIEPIFALKNSK